MLKMILQLILVALTFIIFADHASAASLGSPSNPTLPIVKVNELTQDHTAHSKTYGTIIGEYTGPKESSEIPQSVSYAIPEFGDIAIYWVGGNVILFSLLLMIYINKYGK